MQLRPFRPMRKHRARGLICRAQPFPAGIEDADRFSFSTGGVRIASLSPADERVLAVAPSQSASREKSMQNFDRKPVDRTLFYRARQRAPEKAGRDNFGKQ